MARAKAFANTFDCASNVLHIYDDGYVVAVACSADRHLHIREHLKTTWPDLEEARSDDGFLSVFVLPVDLPLPRVDHLQMLAVLTDGFHDHRYDDHYMIDHAADLMKWMLDQRAK